MFQASPRSWVTTSTESPSSSRSLSSSARISPRTEASSDGDRLVGDEHLRLEDQRAGDDDALALAAGQLVRVAQEVALRRAQAGPGQRLGDQLPARRPATLCTRRPSATAS